jgi:glycosyltransferase involved in cell wall biosynthesis
MNNPNSLHVMIDISAVPYGRGISRYTSNLVTELAQQNGLEMSILGYSRGHYRQLRKWSDSLPKHIHKTIWPYPPTLIERMWQITKQPLPSLRDVDVIHAWDWRLWPVKNIPQVVTIHDLAYKLFPHTAHPRVKTHYDQLLAQLERSNSARVIAVSHATRADILRLTKIPVDRVHVVYEALPEEARVVPSEETIAKVKQANQLEKPFWLFVGTTEPRKNLTNIIAAWKQVKDQFDLVIAGAAGWDEYEVIPGMHILGYVEGSDLAALYRLAHVLVYPSLYEGFGLPILEAYFHNCPVVTSRNSAMAEIAGKPAILVDPVKPGEIAEAAVAIEAPGTRARRQRERDMQTILKQFSWERTARETRDVYELARGDI